MLRRPVAASIRAASRSGSRSRGKACSFTWRDYRGRSEAKRSLQPARKLPLELAAAARGGDAFAQASTFDHAQGRERLDAEALCEVGTVLHRDAHEIEGVVVLPSLQDLSEEAFGPTAAPREG